MRYPKLLAIVLVGLVCTQAQAGKYRYSYAQGLTPCQQAGTCDVSQAYQQPSYYTTGQGATYAPPTVAPVTDPAQPGRVLTYPVAYQPELTPEMPPAPKAAEVKASATVEAKPAGQWITLTNYPGYSGLGTINANGYVVPEKWRNDSTGEVSDSAPTVQAAQVQTADPYGFTSWLNGVRAQYGLGAVGHDANLSAWAAVNNDHQNAYGMGHHVFGNARRQNSGMGASTTVFQMWMASPAHRAALLDPSISWIGIAASGAYWTFNAN